MGGSARKGRGQLTNEYVVMFFLVVAAVSLMSVYVRRAIQGRVYDAKKGMIAQAQEGAGTSFNILNEYEPYYPETFTRSSSSSEDYTQIDTKNGYTKIPDKTTNSETNSLQFPPCYSTGDCQIDTTVVIPDVNWNNIDPNDITNWDASPETPINWDNTDPGTPINWNDDDSYDWEDQPASPISGCACSPPYTPVGSCLESSCTTSPAINCPGGVPTCCECPAGDG